MTTQQIMSIKPQGFTLIEFLSVVAVISIIGFSTPKIIDIMNTSKQTAVLGDFAKTVAFAREQAMTRKTPVSMCIANKAHSDCSLVAHDWQNGYLVKIEKTGQILKNQISLPAHITIISSDNSNSSAIEFSGNGLISSARLFKVCDNSNPDTTRNMIINNGSEIRIANFTYQGKCTS